MPRFVDPDERREEIVQTSLKLLADQGPKALNFRALAKEMGKSVTSITHYYDNRQALIEDINKALDEEWLGELAELRAVPQEPSERLWTLLDWLLPIGELARREEKMRFTVLVDSQVELFAPARTHFNTEVEAEIADCLRHFVPKEDVSQTVKSLRVTIAGIVLLNAEYPAEWDPEAQRALLSDTLRLMGLPAGPKQGDSV